MLAHCPESRLKQYFELYCGEVMKLLLPREGISPYFHIAYVRTVKSAIHTMFSTGKFAIHDLYVLIDCKICYLYLQCANCQICSPRVLRAHCQICSPRVLRAHCQICYRCNLCADSTCTSKLVGNVSHTHAGTLLHGRYQQHTQEQPYMLFNTHSPIAESNRTA